MSNNTRVLQSVYIFISDLVTMFSESVMIKYLYKRWNLQRKANMPQRILGLHYSKDIVDDSFTEAM